jgi:N-acetylglutamate synthase-like GNAT family acetyltransferase
MHVRQAEPSDAPAIQALYEALVPGDENIAVDPAHLSRLQSDSDSHLLVLVEAGSVCGTAFLTICRDPMYGDQPYGVVENVIVLAPARRLGAGRALMDYVERVARAARCTKLMLLSSAARADAHVFFTRLGYDGARKRGFVKYLNR